MSHQYNGGKSKPSLLKDSDSMIGFSNTAANLTNGVLKCSFSRVNSLASVTNYFDTSQQYFILIASGDLESGEYNSFLI